MVSLFKPSRNSWTLITTFIFFPSINLTPSLITWFRISLVISFRRHDIIFSVCSAISHFLQLYYFFIYFLSLLRYWCCCGALSTQSVQYRGLVWFPFRVLVVYYSRSLSAYPQHKRVLKKSLIRWINTVNLFLLDKSQIQYYQINTNPVCVVWHFFCNYISEKVKLSTHIPIKFGVFLINKNINY